MNDAAADPNLFYAPKEWIRRDPEHVAASTPAFAYPKEIDTQYWAWNDPRWGGEGGKYAGPWGDVLKAAGFKGTPTRADPSGIYQDYEVYSPNPYGGEDVGSQLDFSPEAYAAIDKLRAAGYDLRWKHPDRRTFNTYWGLVTPEGNVQDIKIAGSDLGDMIKPMIKIFGAGLGLAGLGAGINSLLGGAGAGSGAGAVNALAGGGIGGTSGAAFADIAGGLLPEFGTSAAYSAGLQGLPAVGGVLSATDLASLPSDVLGQTTFPSPAEAVDLSTGGGLRTPISTGSGYELVPATSGGGTGLQPYKNFLGGADLTPIDIAPNVGTSLGATTSALDAGLAAAGSAAGSLAGAGATGGVAGGGATAPAVADVAATGATGAATGGGAAVPTAATGAATGGDFLSGMADVAATEGAGVAGTGILTSGTNIPSTVLSGGSLLDKAVQLVTSPVGQAVVGGVGSVVGGVLEANAAEKAAETQSQAAANALALQREMFEYQKSLLEPYRTAGTKALERLSGAMGLGGPGSQQQMLEMDPGYGFRLGEGLKALERMQASRGNFLSGGALKAGQRFAQDTASQEYGNAYNRLANIAGLGQTAGTQMGGAAAGFGTSAGNIMGQEANALAAGRLGRTSAYTGALGGALNSFQNYLNRQQEERLVRDIFGRTTVGG